MAEDATFRAAVRNALAAPLGGTLASRFCVPAVTALAADGRDAARGLAALEELVAALARIGLPRGRQFVLVSHAPGNRNEAKAFARAWRAALGVPVLVHDPERPAAFVPGVFADGAPCELDDELREAEEVVLVGRIEPGAGGAPALLWPGLSTTAAGAAATALARGPAGAAAARARETLALVPAGFALVWTDDEPPRIAAGPVEAAEAALAPHAPRTLE